MSAPAFAWAFEMGVQLGLTPSQLLLLAYMADQANCVGSFFTGQPRLVKYTRLSERTVRQLIPQLEALGLIRVTATPGKPTQYHILRQPIGAELTAAPATTAAPARIAPQANGAGVNSSTARQPLPPHPGNLRQAPRQNLHATPAATAPDPYLPKKSTQERARVRAQGSDDFSGGEKEASQQAAPPPPAPPPKAPVLGTTSGGGSSAYIPARSTDAFLDDPSPDDALPKAEADAIASDLLDQPITDPAQALAEFERVKRALRSHNYPPRAAAFDRDEQIDLCQDKPRHHTRPIPADQLAILRRLNGMSGAHPNA